jgi:hypothetical protein
MQRIFLMSFCLMFSSAMLLAGPAEDLATRRAQLKSMEYGLSAWCYNPWSTTKFNNPINYYNGIDPADANADLRYLLMWDLTVHIEANRTLTMGTLEGYSTRSRSLFPDYPVLTVVDATSYDGGFSGANGTFSNWSVSEYEAAADLLADTVLADPDSDGIQMDIEPISHSWMPFMRRLATRFHEAGKLCTLYWHPSWTATGDTPLTDDDIKELFTICDAVAIDLYTETKRGESAWKTWASNNLARVFPLADSVNGNLTFGIHSSLYVPQSLEFASEYRGNVSFRGLAIYDLTFKELSTSNADIIHAWVADVSQMADQVSNPLPADGATNQSVHVDLSWDTAAGAQSYDVYFGVTNNMTFQGNQTSTTFDPGVLAHGTAYQWRVDTVNSVGVTDGWTWSFTTAEPITIEVNPASASVPEGGTQTFDVRLNILPDTDITVNVTRDSGDDGYQCYFRRFPHLYSCQRHGLADGDPLRSRGRRQRKWYRNFSLQ